MRCLQRNAPMPPAKASGNGSRIPVSFMMKISWTQLTWSDTRSLTDLHLPPHGISLRNSRSLHDLADQEVPLPHRPRPRSTAQHPIVPLRPTLPSPNHLIAPTRPERRAVASLHLDLVHLQWPNRNLDKPTDDHLTRLEHRDIQLRTITGRPDVGRTRRRRMQRLYGSCRRFALLEIQIASTRTWSRLVRGESRPQR